MILRAISDNKEMIGSVLYSSSYANSDCNIQFLVYGFSEISPDIIFNASGFVSKKVVSLQF